MKTFALIAAATVAAIAMPAAAQDLQVKVPYANLDVASEADAAVLASRIESGIRTACGRNEATLKTSAVCENQMIASAVEQLKDQGATLVAGNLAARI